MALTETPICNFDEKVHFFSLKSINNRTINFDKIKGRNGTLIMFICNHCPYVKAVITELVETTKIIEKSGFNSVAIMSNDFTKYPEDSPINMKKFSETHSFNFEYLIDPDQSVARKYNAVCTPDFFCYNKYNKLQYRGRIRKLNNLVPDLNSNNELLDAVNLIIGTSKGPKNQIPSIGCGIKWK